MTVSNWISIAAFTFFQLATLLGAYWRIRIKLTQLEMKLQEQERNVNYNRKSFHVHEKQNEDTFSKLESKVDSFNKDMNKGFGELKTLIIEKL